MAREAACAESAVNAARANGQSMYGYGIADLWY